MENKLLWSKPLNNKVISSVVVKDDHVVFEFGTDDKITFSTYHGQDCCEHVYGDFSVMKYHVPELVGKKIEQIEVKGVAEMGFLLSIQHGYEAYIKIFIPCYNYQNGYYSDALALTVREGDTTTEIDITNCVEQHVY